MKNMNKLIVDFESGYVTVEEKEKIFTFPIGTEEAFMAISKAWLRSGWDTKYVYSFTWLGRPIIQLPEDMFRIQEVIYKIKPDVIIETGVAHGGSLVFYATLCKAMGRGRVIGVDIEIRPHNRRAIESHELSDFITLIEGNSVDEKTIEAVKSLVKPGEKVIVILDSNHTKQHVLAELRAYSELVSVGSYIVVCDGIMEDLVGAPRSREDWSWNNPKAAAEEFVKENDNFIIEEPEFLFNEGIITKRVTYWKSGFLRRIK
ncbi:MAG: cephalosporin hydroxylase family protein [Candidatus Calescibacterium sp.]|jgi:cephalosporin hydroxylase